jgi:hypothetical protein
MRPVLTGCVVIPTKSRWPETVPSAAATGLVLAGGVVLVALWLVQALIAIKTAAVARTFTESPT